MSISYCILILTQASGINQAVDTRVITKIHYLVNRGVTDVDEMRKHLREFVRIEIFPGREVPPPTSRQYFPTKKDVYNHMYRAMVKSRFSNCDQTNAEEKVKEWQTQTSNDKCFFRKYSDICDAKFENDVVTIPATEGTWMMRTSV